MQRGSLSDDPPPPTLPPRPGARVAKPVPAAPEAFTPQEPDAVYDDCGEEPAPEYDDCEKSDIPPPLPPHPEAFYDDVNEQHSAPTLPQRPPPSKSSQPPPLTAPQDTYDDLGPIVQHIPKRQLPPPPPDHAPPTQVHKTPASSIYELDGDEDLPSQNQTPLPPPPPAMEDPGAVYEVEPDVDPQPSYPPPPAPAPMLPPKSPGVPKLPPQPAKAVTSPGPKSGGVPTSGFAMDLGQLQNVRAGLKKVSVDNSSHHDTSNSSSSSSSHDTKVYGECPDNVYDAKKIFQGKAEGRPEILSPKPQLAPKPDAFSSGSKPDPVSPPAKGSSPSPRVAEASHNKHGAPPHVHTPPSPNKPVAKPEPREEVFDEPEDIYDDASSSDPLACYDWYHGNIPRQVGDQRVRSVGKDGAFLVRVSEKDPKFPFTLVVLHNKQVNNLRIRLRADGKVALGDEKTGEVAFEGVPKMIEHHRQHHVVLLGNNQSQVKLQHMAPKS